NHINRVCSTWGREHFKTFDGYIYQFPGLCEYNLVSECHSSYQAFSVHLKRAMIDGNPTISYIKVTANDLSFQLSRSAVIVNEEASVMLPYHNGGVKVEKSQVYTKLESKLGFTVMWNDEDSVLVEIDEDFANRTCGLCGDFSGSPRYNEFIEDGREISPIEFGNKQRVQLPNDECEDPHEEEEDLLKQSHCEYLFLSDSWSSCTEHLNPAVFIQACTQDMCSCSNSSDDLCVCSTLSEFSRQCSHAGGEPPNWRSPQFCDKQCPYNMVFEESGSPCMDTCTHQKTSSMCEEHKIDGCYCPPGTVFDDISMKGCIFKSECQCKRDRIYNSGEMYKQGQEICKCYEGKWSCDNLLTTAQCSVEEGSHVTTFDGKSYTFHGECLYTLVNVGSSPAFRILAQLEPCTHLQYDTCLKTLKFLLNNDRNNVSVKQVLLFLKVQGPHL
uniref:VWFD domain-containing protein n=1 Tax=Oryzias latipes TaxID=8090 RepID=A0A3P9M1S5_ORYLA